MSTPVITPPLPDLELVFVQGREFLYVSGWLGAINYGVIMANEAYVRG